MAQSTIPLPPPFIFPQFFEREIARVDRILAVAENLSACSYESPESSLGACDGGHPCYELGTVTEISSGLVFCAGHFRG